MIRGLLLVMFLSGCTTICRQPVYNMGLSCPRTYGLVETLCCATILEKCAI